MTKDPLLLRLRAYVAASDLTGNGNSRICTDVKAAADEIERLRGLFSQLRAAWFNGPDLNKDHISQEALRIFIDAERAA